MYTISYVTMLLCTFSVPFSFAGGYRTLSLTWRTEEGAVRVSGSIHLPPGHRPFGIVNVGGGKHVLTQTDPNKLPGHGHPRD